MNTIKQVALIGGGFSGPAGDKTFPHFDELLSDMGASKRKQANFSFEEFSYPNAEAFGSFLTCLHRLTRQGMRGLDKVL